MLVENKGAQAKLKAIAGRLANYKIDRDDLMQEMMIHLWEIEKSNSEMNESWYIQNCKFFARDLIRKGTSIDSKFREGVTLISRDDPGRQKLVSAEPVDHYDFRSELIVKEIISHVWEKLGKAQRIIFKNMLTGMTISEIGRHLHLSHQRISYGKKKIASLAIHELKHVSILLLLCLAV